MKKRVLVCLASAALAAATFADGLPAGYTEVPYLKLNGQCRVKTGLTPTSTDIVEMSWRPSTVSGNQNLWCSRISGTQQFTVFMIANKVRFDRNGAQVTSAETIAAATDYTIVANYGTLAGSVTKTETGEAVTSVTMTDGDYTPGSELCIFASHDASVDAGLNNYGSYRFYSFKLKASDGTVKCDLVPAKRDSDGVLGVYDVKRSLFLENDLTGAFTTAGMTITPSDPQWGAALTVTGDVTIDAGSGATWFGAITVLEGALKTRGNLFVSGSTVVEAGGTLDVEGGSAKFTFGNQTMRGTLIVRAGAELKANVSDSFHYSGTFNVHVYGTFNCQTFRQSINATSRLYLHDGARVIGAGDANAGIDFYQDNTRMVVDGSVVCEVPFKSRTAGHNLKVACFEGADIKFLGGFKTSAGNVVQEAATAEEGNTSATCATAKIEIGGVTEMLTGSFTFASDAVLHLRGASICPVTTTGASLELRSDKATALANHVAVQTLPVVTTTTATVRLTGNGTVALPDAAPSYPIVFDGATLQIAADAPVALAAGSSVASATVVGVEGLAASTPATLFTGADAAFDVSKLSASAMSHGVALGTPAVTTLADGTVSTAGVAAYDDTAWIEPYIKATALIWLDASDAANFEFKDNTFGLVTTWKDKSAYKRDASYYTSPAPDKYVRNYGTYGISAGVPAFLMGTTGSDIDLKYARMTNMRSIFWVMAIEQNGGAWFLGDSGQYRFHRTSTLAYAYNNANVYFKDGSIYCDGVKAANPISDIPPTDRHVYSTVNASNNMESDYLTSDVRDAASAHSRSGGRDISELIAFSTVLSDADREAIEAYLMAKWMGANPSAAQSDATSYKFTGEYEIDEFVGGDKNLQFAEGSSVSFSNPSSSEPMLSTTGSVTLPSGTPLAVNVDAQSLPPGTYTVMQAASGITSLSQFAPTATVGAGASATFAVVDGKLTMTITVSSSVASQTWRPASSADLGWNTTSANWLYDGGTTGGFIPYVPAFIDGAESATGDITVDGEMFAGPITLTGAGDYALTGTGTLKGGDTVTFGGTGTVTLDGVSFGNQEIEIKDGQKVVLGVNAAQKSFGEESGSTGGKVTVKDGGQLNINDTETTSTTTSPRHEITHTKIFSIAGDGPDGRGALINDALDGRGDLNPYGSQFRRIELEGDATVGGTHRMEVRAHTATSATATPGIYGPDKRLTVKSTNPYGFGIVSQPINVGAITIAEGATLRPEAMAESQLDIPGGITFDGGILHGYNSTYPATVPLHVTEKGGTLNAASATGTFKGPLDVASGGTLTFNGGNTTTLNGAVTNNGAIAVTAGTVNFYGPYVGNEPTISGGQIRMEAQFDTAPSLTQDAGVFYFGSGFSAPTANFTQVSGTWGFSFGATAPQFETLNLTAAAGPCNIMPQNAGILDVPGTVNINQATGNTYVFGPGTNTEYGVALKMVGSVNLLGVGVADNRSGTLKLKEGSDLTTSNLFIGDNASGPSAGRLIIDQGAKVKLTANSFRNGHWSGTPAGVAVHKIEIYGEIDASSAILWNTYDSPRGEVYLKEGGLLKVGGIWANRHQNNSNDTYNHPYGDGTISAGAGRHWFLMEGGRLELGSNGFGGARTPGVTRFDFQNGEMVNTSAAWGGDAAFPLFFGYEKLGGKVIFDMAEYYVNWNTGLSGASDVTLRGSVNFQGQRTDERLQGALLGKFTVENTGANDLRVASCFGGGLVLADNVNAQVAKYSDDLYPFAIAGNVQDQLATAGWSYPYVAGGFWNFIHTHYGSNPRRTYTSFAGRGEFYVPEDKAGKWTFAGNYDDQIRIDVDGTQVFKSASWTAVGVGSVELTAGWHSFTLSSYDGTGGCGPGQATWSNGKSIGFFVGESTSTTSGDYIKFEPGAPLGDGTTLQVRPKANVCVWSWQNGNGSWDSTESWSFIKCLDTVAPMHKHNSLSDASSWTSYFSGKASKFEGWFKVENGAEGEWTFNMGYDDNKQLKIDGQQLINHTTWNAVATGKKTLDPGWHRWEVRVSDGSGGWGPGSVNGGNALSFVLPGTTENKQWNETNLKLAATLGDIAVLEPTGIYKELELGEGATLTSAGTMAMPIFGTLKGTGTLAGSFEFAGDVNGWDVTGVYNNRNLACAKFAAPTRATFLGLKEVKAEFDSKPVCSAYFLTDAEVPNLAASDLADVKVTVTAGEKDFSSKFSVGLYKGRLALLNRTPGGMVLFVR